MCRMLGVIASNLDNDLLADFRNLAVTGKIRAGMDPGHFDGWGMAGYVNGSASYFGRSVEPANKDPQFAIAADEIAKKRSNPFMAHIRKASSGSTCLENTHPFIRDNWIFCHNGTIHNAESLPFGKFKPSGTADSERFFGYLLNKLRHCEDGDPHACHCEEQGDEAISEIATPWQIGARNGSFYGQVIRDAIKEITTNCDYTSLTFLLTNGKHLIAYRDYNENSDEADQFAGYYTLYLVEEEGFTAVCSEPIANLNFKPLKNKELVIVSNDLQINRSIVYFYS